MVHKLGISAYGEGPNPKHRVMLTEEDEYTDGLYATNDSERNSRPSAGGNTGSKDPKANGGYARGNTPQFPCPAGCEHNTSWGSLATCKNF